MRAECVADNGIDTPLRKVIHLSVIGKDLGFSFITKLKQSARNFKYDSRAKCGAFVFKSIVISDSFREFIISV
jgi:hypothetical protein